MPSAPPDPAAPEDPASPGRRGWSWIPSLYLQQGLPYVLVMSVSVVLYKNLGLTNTALALYTSGLYLPWVLKPLWAPLVAVLGRQRRWIVATQASMALLLLALALALPGPHAVAASLTLFWLIALASATHDIAADGFYLLALTPKHQAAFVGVRSAFFRLANIAGQGLLVALVGLLLGAAGGYAGAWSQALMMLAGLFAAMALWHALMLPRPPADAPPPRRSLAQVWREALRIFAEFFRRPDLLPVLAFLLLYRFPEAQLLKLATPFLLDGVAAGGLGLDNARVGLAYGTVGVLALTAGGLLGGVLIARFGLRRCLWPLVAAMHVPNAVFLALAWWQPQSLPLVSAALALEQFGYGLGFSVYLVAMMAFAGERHPTAHYALCTGFMALGMMLPGLWSGWLQSWLGYAGFFSWVLVATLPSLAATALLRVPDRFGQPTDR